MTGRRNASLLFVFITLLIDITGLGIIIPVMPKLIMELTGKPLSEASLYGGWMMLAFSVMQFFFSPVLGNLSDRFGRRPVLLISVFGFGVDYLLMAFAPTIGWLFAGRIIAGLAGANLTTAMAYISDITPPEKRAQNFGLVGVAFGVGFIIGPVIGGVLGEFGSRIPFFASAGLALLNWLYGFFVVPESLKPENRRAFDWKRANPVGTLLSLRRYPVIIGLMGCFFCVYVASHAVQSTWSYFTMEKFHWDESMVGYSLGLVGLVVAFVQGGLIRVVNPRLGNKNSVYLGFTLYIIGMLLFAFSTESWMMYAFILPYCLGGIAGPALQSTLSNQVAANEQGELQGGLTSLISVAAIIGPWLMTHLFSYFTSPEAPIYLPGAPFIMGSILMVLSFAFAYRSFSKQS